MFSTFFLILCQWFPSFPSTREKCHVPKHIILYTPYMYTKIVCTVCHADAHTIFFVHREDIVSYRREAISIPLRSCILHKVDGSMCENAHTAYMHFGCQRAPAQAPRAARSRRLSHHTPSARGASRLSRQAQAVLALGRPLAGQHRWRGSLDETSWLEYEGLTGLSGLSEAPEPDSDGWMCIDST